MKSYIILVNKIFAIKSAKNSLFSENGPDGQVSDRPKKYPSNV
jgi:hypothetical protein